MSSNEPPRGPRNHRPRNNNMNFRPQNPQSYDQDNMNYGQQPRGTQQYLYDGPNGPAAAYRGAQQQQDFVQRVGGGMGSSRYACSISASM